MDQNQENPSGHPILDPQDGEDGVRRSNRGNFGQPPNRYGSWQMEDGSFFTSTKVTAADGTPMKRTTFVAPPNAVVKKAEDNASVSSHKTAGSLVDLLDDEIAKMEKTVNDKISFLKSLKEMRDEQHSKLQSEQQLESDVADEEEEEEADRDMWKPQPILKATGRLTGNYFSTPRVPGNAPVKPPRRMTSKPKSSAVPLTTEKVNKDPFVNAWVSQTEVHHPPQWDAGYGERTRLGNPPQTGGGYATDAGFGAGATGATTAPPTLPAISGVDALASALVQALQIQSKNTERFVARQSHGSTLPTFSGNPLDWPLFEHHYRQSTDDCGFTPAQNMTRLEKALRGEARKTVRALMIVPNNADEVIRTLEQRFGRPEYIIQALVDIARKTPTPKESKLSSIVDYSIAVRNLVTTVKTLNERSYLLNPQLLQELVEKLPDQFKFQWGMHVLDLRRRVTLEDFSQWINRASEAASMVTTPKLNLREKKEESNFNATEDPVPDAKPTRGAQVGKTATAAVMRPCGACGKEGHQIGSCGDFQKLPVNERWDLVKAKNRCFRCLRAGHSLSSCKSKSSCRIEGCSRRHHTLLHGSSPVTSGKEPDKGKEKDKVEEINASVDSFAGSSLLKILVVTLYGPGGEEVTVNALLDEGSTVTLICSRVAEQLGLSGSTDPLRIRWTNGASQEDPSSQKVDCWIGPVGGGEKYKLKKMRTVTNLNLPAQRLDLRDIVKLYPHLQSTKLKYLPGEKPLILIGQPHIHVSVAREIIETDDISPMISKTKLGWVMHGPSQGPAVEEATFSCHHETDDDLLHDLVKESFALESIGIRTSVSTRFGEDEEAKAMMDKITCRVGDRWQTGLLWRKEAVTLPPSRDVALRRLHSIERKLKRKDDIAQQYRDKIDHYLTAGYARKLSPEELCQPSNVEWYLPHFDRMHPNKPGKIRIVFDAASRANGVSLNDYLLTGPDLLVSLPGILLKFRQRKIAISGDIGEMFHQVRIRPEDCPAQRFLWRKEGEDHISTYQLEVMMFGSVCSPFCAQYVKNRNAMEFQDEYPKAAEAIVQKHYMDDYLDSMDSEEEAIKLAKEVSKVHGKGGFIIGKWIANSRKMVEALSGETAVVDSKNLAEWSEVPTERALGLHWIPEEDSFTFRVNLERAGNGIATGEVIPTKRAVLRLVMLVWDPLGFLGHYMIKARILLQDLWRTKIGWDDQLTAKQFKRWKIWIEDLPKLAKVRIPRCYSSYASSSPEVTLHIFADSSEAASCAIAYLRVKEETEEVTVAMVMAKTRVAPVKPCSVPRLELTAALIASRLGKFIQETLDIKIHGVTYWTDSMTTLRWIRAEARKFQQFVAVRVGEIQENSNITQWRWVPSAENPADDGTRDGRPDLSENSRWWNGPAFLKLEEKDFPVEPGACPKDADADGLELRREFLAVVIETPKFRLPDVGRFSSYWRIVRSTAWILKFLERIKNDENPSRLLDIPKAEYLLWKRSQWEAYPQEMQILSNGESVPKSSQLFQLSPMLDEFGVLRMKSRLAAAEKRGIRCPVILHSKEKLTRLLLQYYHQIFLHAGEDLVINEVRQKFWIPQIRTAARKVIRECIICRKKRIQAKPPVMGDLPGFKLQPQPRAFHICGMDYFGPLDATVGRRHEKRYGVLFTCMNTRAVHLEIAHSLTTDSCILAIRRMISRRGQPKQMYSDNGTNLRGADKELRKALLELDQEKITAELSTIGMEWHFIPPSSPHMGGSWERLVRSVKTALGIILKCRAPRDEVLLTVFAEAEATVNSRPLTDVPVDPGSQEALTPFHFLIGTSSTLHPPGVFVEKEADMQKQWRKSQALANMFWKRWMREYIPTLQRRAKWHQSQASVQVGDLVVVLDESLRRNTWPMGIVTQTFPGGDQVVRVAEVRTASGIYRRPVIKLGKLDVRAADKQD